MKNKRLFLTIVLIIIFTNFLFAQTNSSETLLCNAGWKKAAWKVVPAMQYRPTGGVESDLLKNERECTKDDYYVFNANGTYQLLNGVNKCSPTEADLVSSGKWAFMKNDNTILNMVKGDKGGILQKKVVELSEYGFSFTTTQIKNDITYTFTETFVPIQ
jgi:hypothetical protein